MKDDLFYTSKIDLFHNGEFVDVEYKGSAVIDGLTIADLSAKLDSIVETLQRIETGVAEFNLKCQR